MKMRTLAIQAGVLAAFVTLAATGGWLGQRGDSAEAAPEQDIDLNPTLVCSGPATVTFDRPGIRFEPAPVSGSLSGTLNTCTSPNRLRQGYADGIVRVDELSSREAGCTDQLHRFSGDAQIQWPRQGTTIFPFDGSGKSDTEDKDQINEQHGISRGGGLDALRTRTSFEPIKSSGNCDSGITKAEGVLQVFFLTPVS